MRFDSSELSINFFFSGIFAYLNYHVPRTRREILETLIKGLQRLEYRGYDSAGISFKYVKGFGMILESK